MEFREKVACFASFTRLSDRFLFKDNQRMGLDKMVSLQEDIMSVVKNLQSSSYVTDSGSVDSPSAPTDTTSVPDSHESAGSNALPLVAQSFLASIFGADGQTEPFNHWLLVDALPAGYCEAIASMPFHAPTSEEANFDGRRNTNDDLRVYFNAEKQAEYPVIKEVVEGFKHPLVRQTIEEITGADLSDGHLRIEYCQDTPGFWLEPHTDIFVKKFTMLVYLLDDEDLALTGTDIHQGPPNHEYVGSAPYGLNKGVIFIPGDNTWHAVGKNPIPAGKIRKSIIINYVTSDWKEKWELA
jgi:hypothetical protein